MAKINLSEYPFAYYSPDPVTKRPIIADIGSAISVGGTLLGGMIGDSASGDAAGQANAGLQMGIDELRKTDARTLEQTQPYRDLGEASVNKLSYLLGTANTAGSTDKYTRDDFLKSFQSALSGMDYSPRHQEEMANFRADEAYAEYLKNPSKDFSNWKAYGKANGGLRELKDTAPLDTSDGKYGSLLKSFSQDDLNKDVVYNNGLKFGLDQGTTQLNNRAAAMGSYDSGQTLKDLAKWANDYGTTKTGEAQQRFMGDKAFTLGSLMGGTGVGQSAVNTSANSGTAIGSAIAGSMGSMGSNNAAGTIGSANSWSTAIGGATKAAAGIDWSKWFN